MNWVNMGRDWMECAITFQYVKIRPARKNKFEPVWIVILFPRSGIVIRFTIKQLTLHPIQFFPFNPFHHAVDPL